MKRKFVAIAVALAVSSGIKGEDSGLFTYKEIEGKGGKGFLYIAFKENKSQEEWLKDIEEFSSLSARIGVRELRRDDARSYIQVFKEYLIEKYF